MLPCCSMPSSPYCICTGDGRFVFSHQSGEQPGVRLFKGTIITVHSDSTSLCRRGLSAISEHRHCKPTCTHHWVCSWIEPMTLVLGAFALSTCLNRYSWSPTAAAEPVCLHSCNPFQLRDICNGKLNRTHHSQVCCNAYPRAE